MDSKPGVFIMCKDDLCVEKDLRCRLTTESLGVEVKEIELLKPKLPASTSESLYMNDVTCMDEVSL